MNRKTVSIAGLFISLIIIVFYLTNNLPTLTRNPLSTITQLEYPSFAFSDTKGNVYVIDKSRRRVVSADKNGILLSVIEGGKKETGSFFYANDIRSDGDGNIYILNWVLDKAGFFMEREEILKYRPDGSFDRIIYAKKYDEKSVTQSLAQRGELSLISATGESVRWFDIDKSGIWTYTLDKDTGSVASELTESLPEANLLVINAAYIDSETLAYSTKRGNIFLKKKGHTAVILYSADAVSGSLSIPWNVGADRSGTVYFPDLEKRNIMKIKGAGFVVPFLSQKILKQQNFETEDYTYYRVVLNDDGVLTTCNDTYVISMNSKGEVKLHTDSFRYSTSMMIKSWLSWILLAAGTVLLVLLARIFYIDVMNRKIPGVMIRATGLIVVIVISAVLISNLIIKNFSERYQKDALNKIAQMVQVMPKIVNAEKLERITKHSEYLGSDYRALRENLISALNYNRDDWNRGYYFVLYRVMNDRLYAFMYLNGEVGIYYPLPFFDDPDGVYRRAYKGEIATEQASDEWGSWLDGVGPIYNSRGEIIALLEVGTDLYSFNQENSRLVKNIILDVVTMLVIFVLVMIEGTFLLDMLNQRIRRIRLLAEGRTLRQSDIYSDAFLARPVTFLFFTAISMSIVFIPLMMETFYKPVPGVSKNLILGLPISSEMLFFALASIISGRMISRFGWRTVMRFGFLITAAGLISSALSGGMINFIVARGVAGFGSGLFFMSMRGLVNHEGMKEMRNTAFSHFYSAMIVGVSIGAVIGGVLADKFDYASVFYFALIVLLVAFIFDLFYFNHISFMEEAVLRDISKDSLAASFRTFFSNPLVLGFFLMIVIPTYVASMFIAYFFPIFAEANNVSSSDVGRLFIVNGIFIIYLGPVLSRFFERKFNAGSIMVIGSMMWACALLVSALTGTIAGAVIALILMGITEGFCVSAQNDYFLDMKASAEIGEDQAIGYFEMVGKFSEMLGPILFSLAIILGQLAGLSLIAAAVFALAVLYVIIAKKQNKQSQP